MRPRVHSDARRALATVLVFCLALILAACGNATPVRRATHATSPGRSGTSALRPPSTTATTSPTTPPPRQRHQRRRSPPSPGDVDSIHLTRNGRRRRLDRRRPPGSRYSGRLRDRGRAARGHAGGLGIVWMDTRLLSAQLYSGSKSPGGGPYELTAPVQPAAGGDFGRCLQRGLHDERSRGRLLHGRSHRRSPARRGGFARDLCQRLGDDWSMGHRRVHDTRRSRRPPKPRAARRRRPTDGAGDWLGLARLGGYARATSCSSTDPGLENQWRSGAGVTIDGALVYSAGPNLPPLLQLAELLVRAGAVRGMELDINPDWPVFATYDPSTPNGLAGLLNGSSLQPRSVRTPRPSSIPHGHVTSSPCRRPRAPPLAEFILPVSSAFSASRFPTLKCVPPRMSPAGSCGCLFAV